MSNPQRPTAAGLYDPGFEHDACGIGAVARLDNRREHEIIERALDVLFRLEHRGAVGSEVDTGDGAGILFQVPDEFFRGTVDFVLPEEGRYGVGMGFFTTDDAARAEMEALVERVVSEEGQTLLGWRDVPVDGNVPGPSAAEVMPVVRQVFIGSSLPEEADELAFERKLYVIRRVIEAEAGDDLVFPSFSCRTIVYKGMLTSPQVPAFYPDLADARVKTSVALVHSRFSTNTFPSWELAHPYRLICHNGEINTVKGNVNWMRARESELASELFADEDMKKILPVVRPGGSDSATFDNVLELLVLGGRSLPHALMMVIPEAWGDRRDQPEWLREFYAYHSCLIEPWDGPASVAFCDGRVIGATLDRNGLRPGRWQLTKDGYVVLASETGVLEYPASEVVAKGRLAPGKIFYVNLESGRIVEDGEIKHEVATQKPYGRWYRDHAVHLDDLPDKAPDHAPGDPLLTRQLLFGYSQEDLRITLSQMGGAKAEEPLGSMGNDMALAVLSDQGPPVYNNFTQLFPPVTNPPIDPIREKVVMSLSAGVGAERNLLDETPEHAHQLEIPEPVLTNDDLEKIRQVDHDVFCARTLDTTWPVADGPDGLQKAMDRLCDEADAALAEGVNILILSDRAVGEKRVPVPALLATAGVHHHLVRKGTRLQCGLVVETA